jgi:hypothetical protein
MKIRGEFGSGDGYLSQSSFVIFVMEVLQKAAEENEKDDIDLQTQKKRKYLFC